MTPTATAATGSAVTGSAVAGPPAAAAPADVPAAAPERTRKVAPYLVDCDCHHQWRQIEDIFPYLPRRYVESIRDFGSMLPKYPYTNVRNNGGGLAYRVDHPIEPDTDLAEFTIEHHLDPYGFDAALLTGSSVYSAAGLPDLDYAAALCRAFNDYTLEHWVAKDPRLLMTIAVPVHAPEEAAAEIERIGPHPAAAAVMMPAGARSPFGNRFYDRIHAAAADQGLPIVTHFGGEGQGPTNAPTAAGFPSYYLEMRMARPQIAQAHSASLICEGVFERYPALRWLFVEVDTWWIPGLLWHFDADWKAVREYTPWVKRPPSEYFREHIRVGTQPLQLPAGKRNAAAFLQWMHAGEVLVYASDFPHWDWDEPTPTAGQFPKELREAVFGGNARELLGLA